MWPFKRKDKNKPTLIVEDLKQKFEKLDFDNEKKMEALLKKVNTIYNNMKKHRDSLEKQIETIGKKLDNSETELKELKEIETKSAKEMVTIDVNSPDRKLRARGRKLYAAVRSARFKIKMFERENKDYKNTEEMLGNLYIDLEDCLNVIEYMTGSLKRNLERVRAANFFTGKNQSSTTMTDGGTGLYDVMDRIIDSLKNEPQDWKIFKKNVATILFKNKKVSGIVIDYSYSSDHYTYVKFNGKYTNGISFWQMRRLKRQCAKMYRKYRKERRAIRAQTLKEKLNSI